MEGLSGARLLGPVLLLSSLAALVSCHPGTCRHQAPPPEEVVHQVHLKPERLTKRSSPEDLQLQIDHLRPQRGPAPCRPEEAGEVSSSRCFVFQDKLFPQAIDYLQKVLSVRRRVGPVLLSRSVQIQCKVCSESGKSCGPIGPPDGPGVEGSDFVLYVSGVTTERCGQENIVAYAAYCQLEAELDSNVSSCVCSLGLYQWSEAVIRRVVRLWDIRGGEMVRHQVHVLVTPRVVNEAMTGSHTQNRVFSRLTLALMEDSGWYRANYSLAERLDWGRGLGCDFVMKSCKFWMDRQRQRSYFDSIPDVPSDQLALFGGAVEIADFCPFSQEFSWHLSGEYQRNSYCRVSLNQPDWWRNYGAEQYGSDSVCLYQKSAFIMEQCTKKMTAGQLLSVSVKLNDWVYNGQLICPACKDFCEHCPLQAPPLNASRSIPIGQPMLRSSGLAFTLWLLMLNLLPLVAGLRLCTHS
ncbi:hypothetical protein F7725_002615 [Dissostichus mawsoni]|uniref:Leishmanolysin-like peptidase n=1 Tax=Dissostichus mawsoni TaxID=36200 RepID=A0A7J5Y2V6_DISMA|nr:hypothetical protein F7725_002615 [Dissostichus mawsoni]